MPYPKIHENVIQRYATNMWVNASSFRKALSALIFLELSTFQSCLKGIEIIKDVLDRYEDAPLFSLDTRFPDDGAYIDLNRYDWPFHITALLQWLNTRQIKLKEHAIPAFSELEDFYKIISTCQQEIGTGDSLYTRCEFEQRFRLTWKDI